MAKYVIVRIGIPVPTAKESEIMMDISNEETDPIGGPIIPPNKDWPISGLISFVSSDLTAAEISERFQEASSLDDDDGGEAFPALVFKVNNKSFAFTKDLSRYIGYGEIIKKHFNMEHSGVNAKRVCNLSLDELLDKISEGGGYNTLSKEEKVALENFKSQ